MRWMRGVGNMVTNIATACKCPVISIYSKPINISRSLLHAVSFRGKSHHQTLGIPITASQDEIRSAYLKMSKLYHPDLNPEDKTLHCKFVTIQEAYTALRRNQQDSVISDGHDSY